MEKPRTEAIRAVVSRNMLCGEEERSKGHSYKYKIAVTVPCNTLHKVRGQLGSIAEGDRRDWLGGAGSGGDALK